MCCLSKEVGGLTYWKLLIEYRNLGFVTLPQVRRLKHQLQRHCLGTQSFLKELLLQPTVYDLPTERILLMQKLFCLLPGRKSRCLRVGLWKGWRQMLMGWKLMMWKKMKTLKVIQLKMLRLMI
uniref:Uncharacterized protein n=1 Tax=Opuntia streptacantha TaxID=393608 RepID=A0A7C9E2L4_OPUST